MTNQALIQSKVWKGYAQAAIRLGAQYQFYRPGFGGLGFEVSENIANRFGGAILGSLAAYWPEPIFSLLVSLNAEDMRYSKPNKYGKAMWYALMDGTSLRVGDYFIGPQGTFFIAGLQPLLPILVVECNRIISLARVQAPSGIGIQPYSGITAADEVAYAKGVPCSILQGTKGEKSEVNLPGDVRAPWWNILMPASVGNVKYGDLMTDEYGTRYIVSSPELTDLGYRITAMTTIA